jgi:hypothetical protein
MPLLLFGTMTQREKLELARAIVISYSNKKKDTLESGVFLKQQSIKHDFITFCRDDLT